MKSISLFDWLAVAIAGQDEPVSRIVKHYVMVEGGIAESTVAGTTKKPAPGDMPYKNLI